MDPFDKSYWSWLQVELWVCTRSRDAVRLAAHAPGSIHLADLSLGLTAPMTNDLMTTRRCSSTTPS